jgi:hypothetical protein
LYGRTKKKATAAIQALALRVIADRVEHDEAVQTAMSLSFVAERAATKEAGQKAGSRQ